MLSDEPNRPPQPPLPDEQNGVLGKRGLHTVVQRLGRTLERDRLVQETLTELRQQLKVDRLVLYYFYQQWRGQVTCEALAEPSLSILGSTGADDCFNDNYATRYLEGRVRAIANIAESELHPCHREFLESLHVKANLVVPVRVHQRLWGLLIAHHCRCPRNWSEAEIAQLQAAAQQLATASAIQNS
ncbi:MAG: GAF domain-containing protein [Leptolyngbya sp. SIO1E4]|nr:GAF domain-containing protein [Leptolyngbya sp. SIO1E4]